MYMIDDKTDELYEECLSTLWQMLKHSGDYLKYALHCKSVFAKLNKWMFGYLNQLGIDNYS